MFLLYNSQRYSARSWDRHWQRDHSSKQYAKCQRGAVIRAIQSTLSTTQSQRGAIIFKRAKQYAECQRGAIKCSIQPTLSATKSQHGAIFIKRAYQATKSQRRTSHLAMCLVNRMVSMV